MVLVAIVYALRNLRRFFVSTVTEWKASASRSSPSAISPAIHPTVSKIIDEEKKRTD